MFAINTNMLAMGALRNLNANGQEMAASVRRLSTGLRINSGMDDPSGLIASEGYRAQIAGLDQASRNVQNATNFAKTADGGLSEIGKLLNQARTLAVANGDASLDNNQKQANQAQLDSIVASITRIGGQTQFGSKNLLDGSSGTSSHVVMHEYVNAVNFSNKFAGSTISGQSSIDIDISTMAAQATVSTTASLTAATDLVGAGTFSINGKSFTTSATTTAANLVDMANAATGDTGVTATLNTGTNQIDFKTIAYGSDASLTVTDSFGLLAGSGTPSATRAVGVDAAANVYLTQLGVHAAFTQGKGLQLKDADGNTIDITAVGNQKLTPGPVEADAFVAVGGNNSFQIGANNGQTTSLQLGDFRANALSLSGLDITNNASGALNAIDTAIRQVASARGNIGSFVKNTLESQSNYLGVAKENMQSADSTIRDLDVANEMSNYSKLQIIQQSGLSILAQANQAPQGVLSLLRG